MCSIPIIVVCGFRLTTSNCRSSTLRVFHRNPRNRRYLTVSANTKESRFANLPVKSSAVNRPSKSNQASPQWTATAGTRMESRMITTVSRGTARKSIIVCDCVLFTAAKSRLRCFNSRINSASSARNLSNSFTVNSSDCTRAALNESRTRYCSTSDSNASVLDLYRAACAFAFRD